VRYFAVDVVGGQQNTHPLWAHERGRPSHRGHGCRSAPITRIAPDDLRTGSRCYGAADGEGCGTLGALSNDTNGAPHVATF
jgi:hypothetical protein